MSSSGEVHLEVEELQRAELELIRLVQKECFSSEIKMLKEKQDRGERVNKSSSLYKLDPFLDKLVLRVGGRLRQSDLNTELKHPVLLKKKHFLTRLLVKHHHKESQHQGRGITTNAIYLLVSGSLVVAQLYLNLFTTVLSVVDFGEDL